MATIINFHMLFTFFITLGSLQSSVVSRSIVVDNTRRTTGFSTIQAAIDSIPSNNSKWVTIKVVAGVHRERITIPANKGYIFLRGAGMWKTVVTWDAHDSSKTSATFESLADNVVVVGISFVNSYNYPPNGNPVKPALAAKISGDKTAFKDCSFSGYQDTLFDDKGRHFFRRCVIEGAIDFIFGAGQSIYQECNIVLNLGVRNPNYVGYITANSRDNPYDNSAFVFKWCNVFGKGKAYLGRAWKSYARVIYYQCYISDIIVPCGWDAWNQPEYQLTFSEEQCKGPGAIKSDRVRWEVTLSPNDLHSLMNLSYISSDGWLERLSYDILYP